MRLTVQQIEGLRADLAQAADVLGAIANTGAVVEWPAKLRETFPRLAFRLTDFARVLGLIEVDVRGK